MSEDFIAGVIKLLAEDGELHSCVAAWPEAIVMPHGKEGKRHLQYLAVSVAINQECASPERVALFLSRATGLLVSSGKLNGLEGVEFILGASGKRIIRFGVGNSALEKATNLQPAEILASTASEDMACVLYQQWAR